jgi:amino acid transporter
MKISTHNNIHSDDQYLIASGYQPRLHRRLGFYSSFAISFSFMSVLMGIFANYGYMLGKSGPFGLWSWLIVGFGQFLVSLVFAEMAGRIPLTGALYNWNNKLHNEHVGWLVGWLLVFAYTIAYAGVMVVLMAPLQSLLGHELDINTIRVIGVVIFLVILLINIYGIRLAAYINKTAVTVELIAIAIFGLVILAAVFLKGELHPEHLTVIPSGGTSYIPAFLMSTLLGAWTLFGFETPADLSEETVNVTRITPKGIVYSVLVCTVLGFFFASILTLGISDLSATTASLDPVSSIISTHLGYLPTELFLCIVLVSIFASALLSITTASRVVFAMARDKRLFGHQIFARVSDRGVPASAAILAVAIEIIFFLAFYGQTALFAAPVVLLYLTYLITILGFAIKIRTLPAAAGFSLGAWRKPVIILAAIWLIGEICILTIPAEFHATALIAGVVILLAVLQYAAQQKFLKTSYISA